MAALRGDRRGGKRAIGHPQRDGRTILGFNRIGIGCQNSGDICHCAKMLRQQIMRMDSVDENGAAKLMVPAAAPELA